MGKSSLEESGQTAVRLLWCQRGSELPITSYTEGGAQLVKLVLVLLGEAAGGKGGTHIQPLS